MSASIQNILHLARRVIDTRAAVEFSAYQECVEKGRRHSVEGQVYRRTYDALLDIRERLTEEGLTQAQKWTGPEATQKIYD